MGNAIRKMGNINKPVVKSQKRNSEVKSYIRYYQLDGTFWYDTEGKFSGCIGDETD